MGALWGVPILLNFSLYRYFHLDHHKSTQQPGDSEPSGVLTPVTFFVGITNWDFVFSFLRLSVASLFGFYPPFVRNSKAATEVRRDAALQVTTIVFLAVLTWFFPKSMSLVYWLPLQIALTLNFLFSVGEHYKCSENGNVFENTRSFKVESKLLKFVLWNGNLHAEHHYSPRTPFRDLTQIQEKLLGKIVHVEAGYSRFLAKLLSSVWENRKLGPKNVEQGRFKNFWYPLKRLHFQRPRKTAAHSKF
jgi:fatty acid desaturase